VPLAEARDVARPALLALETVAHVAACVDPRAALDAGALDGRPAALAAWLEGPDGAACLGDAWGVVRDRMDDAFRRLEEDAPVAVVHGDLHPWNVYLRSAAGEPRCVLIDWGRAAVGHPALDVATVLLAATARERATAMEEIRRRIPAAILGAALDVGLLLQLVGSVELLGALPPADAWQRERDVIGWAHRLALHAAHRGDR
jgi:Ser/Thr protein kinase RdoA (MazF antagonist)